MITTTHNRIDYIGNGTTTDFPYDFPIIDTSDLLVYVDKELKQENVDYTVNKDSGIVSFTTPPPDQSHVLIYRYVEPTQLINYVPYDPFPAELHEKALDKLTMIAQQIIESGNRILKISDIYNIENVYVERNANRYLRWNENATEIIADNGFPYEIRNNPLIEYPAWGYDSGGDNVSILTNPNQIHNFYCRFDNYLIFRVFLYSGNYQLKVLYCKNSNMSDMKVLLNGDLKSTINQYSSSPQENIITTINITAEVSGISILKFQKYGAQQYVNLTSFVITEA